MSDTVLYVVWVLILLELAGGHVAHICQNNVPCGVPIVLYSPVKGIGDDCHIMSSKRYRL